MTTHVKPIWLYVLDCLRLLKRCADPLWESLRNAKGPSEVDVWRAFGHKLGLSEGELRQEQAQARKKDSKDLVGCFFLKCPLYGEDINDRVNLPLRCTGCKLVGNRAPAQRYPPRLSPAIYPGPILQYIMPETVSSCKSQFVILAQPGGLTSHWRHDHKSRCGSYASTPSPTIATLPGPSE